MEHNDFAFASSCLAPGEYILHRCKPGEGHLFTPQDVYLIPFSIIWCGFAFFWEISAITSGAPLFFCLFGLPFIFAGLYLVVGRFFWKAYIRKRTAYVITNKRIIRRRGSRIDILDGTNMPPMQLHTHADGSGSITFGYTVNSHRMGMARHASEMIFMLENIPEVVKVQQIIAGMEK